MRITRKEFEDDLKAKADGASFKNFMEDWWITYNQKYDRWEKGMWIPESYGTEDDFEDFWNEMRFPHYVNNTVDDIIGIVNYNMEAYMLWLTLEGTEETDKYYETYRYWYHKRMMQWRTSTEPTHQVYWWGDEQYSETVYM